MSPQRSAERILMLATALLLTAGCTTTGEQINQKASRRSKPIASVEQVIATSLSGPSQDYRLGPGDQLELVIYDIEKLGQPTKVEVVVEHDGAIHIPLLGKVLAGAKTVAQLRQAIRGPLAESYVRHPSVGVRILEYRSRRVAVLGAVKEPGVKFLRRNRITLPEALALAGGIRDTAALRAIVIRARPGPDSPARQEIDLEALARGDTGIQQIALHPGDVVQVPVAGRILVTGYVNTPGEHPLRWQTTVLEAVGLAGGVRTPDASPSLTRIRRRTPGGLQLIDVDLEAVVAGEAKDQVLIPGDVVEVRQGTVRGVALGFYSVIRGVVSFGYNLATLF